MLQEWQLLWISLIYIGLLFALAYLGKRPAWHSSPRVRSIIYALTLAVYCSSWSFLGTAGQASVAPLSYLPVFFGPIILFIFGWPLLQRMIRVSHRLKLTSIADLIAARFGHSRGLASLVTFVAVVGTMPYMALQIKAIVSSVEVMVPVSFNHTELGLIVVAILTCFTVLFGIRTIDVTERHPGLMLAIAFDSILKLLAFLLVGIFVTVVVFGNPLPQIYQDIQVSLQSDRAFSQEIAPFIGSMVITMAAFLCLPRQFHVMIVECQDNRETRFARWFFPLYLLVFAFLAAPLGKAGQLLLAGQVSPDNYVLYLPHFLGHTELSVLAYLGALSAASSMVIISSIALATMLNNELVFPILFHRLKDEREQACVSFRSRLTSVRKLLVTAVIGLGYLTFLIAPPDTLASLGEMAFGVIGQLSPGLIAAFYWRQANRLGVILGLLVGMFSWFILVLIPQFNQLPNSVLLAGFGHLDVTSGTLLALSMTAVPLWVVSLYRRPSVLERIQAGYFLEQPEQVAEELRPKMATSLEEMLDLCSRFVGEEVTKASFAHLQRSIQMSGIRPYSSEYQRTLLVHSERLLSRVMGSSSAKLVLNSVLQGRDIALNEVAQLVEEASSDRIEFSQHMLQSAIENAEEGISVIDAQLRLVAWNQKYIDLFHFPSDLIRVGTSVEALLRHNIKRGLLGTEPSEIQITRRMDHLKRGTPHRSERELPDGRVIHIQGNPMPFGGFVMTFSDITVYRQTEELLRQSNMELETRVQVRTNELQTLNEALEKAMSNAELANRNKSDYLKSCAHDLTQPLEAARLFALALSESKDSVEERREILGKLDQSLKTASDLISDMSEVARIESGRIQPQIKNFDLNDVLGSLKDEFSALADSYAVDFHMVPCHRWVQSDPKLLRRIIQNLLANAFRYATGSRVLLGCRRRQGELVIEVWDKGPGIAKEKQQTIFEPFVRLQNNNATGPQGLGLGLSIAQGFTQVLDHRMGLVSELNLGSMFSLALPIASKGVRSQVYASAVSSLSFDLAGYRILCVDNDPSVLSAMSALLKGWGAVVLSARSIDDAFRVIASVDDIPQLMLVDYQLDNHENGLELMQLLEVKYGPIAGILLSADTDPDLPSRAQTLGYPFMGKMIKPAKLKALIKQCLDPVG